jgi:hypothetical protein
VSRLAKNTKDFLCSKFNMTANVSSKSGHLPSCCCLMKFDGTSFAMVFLFKSPLWACQQGICFFKSFSNASSLQRQSIGNKLFFVELHLLVKRYIKNSYDKQIVHLK